MSWDSFIVQLKQDGLITDAAICGLDGSIYAKSDGLSSITAEQIHILVGDAQCMCECGPVVGTIKCMMVKDDRDNEHSFCLHLKGNKSSGQQTVCVGRTHRAIIIAVGPPHNPITDTVFKMTKYLRDLNM